MSAKTPKNLPASVYQRLLNRAKEKQRPFAELLQYYAMERFLYRLSQSPHADKFILKGALMLRAWGAPVSRPTKDIDLLGKTSNKKDSLIKQVSDILSIPVEPDGLVFDSKSLKTEPITKDADYQGIRIQFMASLYSAKVQMQIDIGFGDPVVPKPVESFLPTLLDFPQPQLLGYSRESAIAEKFEAMLKLGELNSRIKDFYDIWLLSRLFDFEGEKLADAIRLTLEYRGTPLPESIVPFSSDFARSKQSQWSSFRKRLQQEALPEKFEEIISVIREFLTPITSALLAKTTPPVKWTASDTWT